jgi:hypothetical protein
MQTFNEDRQNDVKLAGQSELAGSTTQIWMLTLWQNRATKFYDRYEIGDIDSEDVEVSERQRREQWVQVVV